VGHGRRVERWLGKASLLLALPSPSLRWSSTYSTAGWAANYPERLRSAFERLGGERIRRFLESSAGPWLRRRFAPREAYGVALTAGLAILGLFSWAFGGIAEGLLSPDPLVRVEVQRFGEKDYGVALGAAYDAHRLWGERQEPQRDYRKELEAAWLDKELGAEEAELLRTSARAT
jgi:hypothetical protein